MNLSHLYYFRTLADVQHYTRAAEKLFITQPTLSNAVSQLEKELGIPLFEKDGRNVRLTKQGREFNEYVVQALDLIDKGVDVAKEQAGSPSGQFDLGVVYTIQADYLPPLMRGFRSLYGPDVRVNTFQGLSNQLIEDLENGRYDVVFCSYASGHDDLEFFPVLNQRLVALVHDYSPFLQRDQLAMDDITHSKVYTYTPGTPIGDEVAELCESLCSETVPIYGTAEDEITLASLVDSDPAGVGITLDTLGILPFVDLKTIPFSDVPDGFHPVYMAYRKNAFQSRAVENFIAFVKGYNPDDNA